MKRLNTAGESAVLRLRPGRPARRVSGQGKPWFFWVAVLALARSANCYSSEEPILPQSVVAIVDLDSRASAPVYASGMVFPSARWVVSATDALQAMGTFTIRLPSGRSLRPKAWYADEVSNVAVIDLGASVPELRPVALSTGPPVGPGERVRVVARSPGGSQRHFGGVVVSGEVVQGASKINLLELPPTPGLSGAAVVGPQGLVLGMIAGRAQSGYFVAYWRYMAVRQRNAQRWAETMRIGLKYGRESPIFRQAYEDYKRALAEEKKALKEYREVVQREKRRTSPSQARLVFVSGDTLEWVVAQLVAEGRVRYGWVGIEVEDIHPSADVADPRARDVAVKIREVTKGSPAAAAGLRTGDVILEWSGHVVTSAQILRHLVARSRPGVAVNVKLRRGRHTRLASVVPAPAPVFPTSGA